MSSADAVPTTHAPTLPSQVSPPDFALSEAVPHAIVGAEVVALPVLPGEAGSSAVLGPGSDELCRAAR